MYYVYAIKSQIDGRVYIGFSDDVHVRIKAHNAGRSIYTSRYKPWVLIFYSAFEEEKTAQRFEHYLKSHSGKSFANKHLLG